MMLNQIFIREETLTCLYLCVYVEVFMYVRVTCASVYLCVESVCVCVCVCVCGGGGGGTHTITMTLQYCYRSRSGGCCWLHDAALLCLRGHS